MNDYLHKCENRSGPERKFSIKISEIQKDALLVIYRTHLEFLD